MKLFYRLLALTTALVSINVSADSNSNLIANGEQLFEQKCDYCHGRGLQKGGTIMLEKRYQGQVPATLQDRTNLTPALIRTFVRFTTRGMAPYRLTEISEADLDALIAYLTRNNP